MSMGHLRTRIKRFNWFLDCNEMISSYLWRLNYSMRGMLLHDSFRRVQAQFSLERCWFKRSF